MYQRWTHQRQQHQQQIQQQQSYQHQPCQQQSHQQSLKATRELPYDVKIQVSGTIKFADNYQIDINNDGIDDTNLPDSLKTIDQILSIIQNSITTNNLSNLRNRYIIYYNTLLNGLYNWYLYSKYFNEWYFRRQWYNKINSLTNQDQKLQLVGEEYPLQLQLTVLPSVQIIKCTDEKVLASINTYASKTYEMVFFDSNNILQEGIYVFDKKRMVLTKEEIQTLKDNGYLIDYADLPTYDTGYFIKTRVKKSTLSEDQTDGQDDVETWRQGYVFYNSLAIQKVNYISFDIFEYSVKNGMIDKDTVKELDNIDKVDINLYGEPEQQSSKDIYINQPSPTWPIYANERDDSKEVDDTTRIYCFMNGNDTQKRVEYVFNVSGNLKTYPYTSSHFQIFYVVCFDNKVDENGNYPITYSNIFYKKRAQIETYDNLVLTKQEQQEE